MAGDRRSGLSESKRNRTAKAARRSSDQCKLSIQTKLIEDSHLSDNFRGFLQTTIAVRRICNANRYCNTYSSLFKCNFVKTLDPDSRHAVPLCGTHILDLRIACRPNRLEIGPCHMRDNLRFPLCNRGGIHQVGTDAQGSCAGL